MSLRTRLSLSYMFITVILLAGITFSANTLLEGQFKGYVIKQQQQRVNELVSLIGQQYSFGNWNKVTIENIGLNALGQGIIIKVTDSGGSVVWDATTHNNGLCTQMIQHMASNMFSRYPNFNGGYVVNSYPLKAGNKVVGAVEAGYYGPYYYNDNDLAFINTMNKIFALAGLALLILAVIVGTYMARRLSMPISKAVATAEQISKGNFKDRIVENYNTKEITRLTETINNLADTLDRQQEIRKHMAADVAHELRTPLATLQSHMEAMIDGIWKPEHERLESCHEEILRISRLVGDMEKLARVENKNIVLDKSEFDLAEAAKHIINNFQPDFMNKGVGLEFTGDSLLINGDRDKISQILINLISNALKYTDMGGAVRVAIECTPASALIKVSDTGSGISAEDIPFIFERFYRADKSRNRLTGGSGIGLAIARAIVELHKGSISVTSEIGRGSEFIVTLPRS